MFKTRSIILRTIKYGETSLVVTAFTELFGVQTYMVNGVRSAKKAGLKASLYQPASLLDTIVYHNEKNTMHRIREANRAIVFEHILTDVVKNSIAVFMMELLYKLLKQPEPNSDLFYFCEDTLVQLDKSPANVSANFPLFFSLQLSHFFGFKIDENYTDENHFLDLQEGNFTNEKPAHRFFMEGENASLTAEILQVRIPQELSLLKMNHLKRRELLAGYMEYYALHNRDFGQMKTLEVMGAILGG